MLPWHKCLWHECLIESERVTIPGLRIYRSKLFQRQISVLFAVILFFSIAIYSCTVPLIRGKAYELERNAAKIILDNVYALIAEMHERAGDVRQAAVESRKVGLAHVVSMAASYIDLAMSKAEEGGMTAEEARARMFEDLRGFKFGKNDYVWVADYRAHLLSHPDAALHQTDFSAVRDVDGRLIMQPMIAAARAEGEAYYRYHWRRLDSAQPSEKISYAKDFPEWGLVIGTGLYLDDIESEIEVRHQQAIAKLRQALRSVVIAKTGYVFIFDDQYNMVIHPNANIELTQFGHLVNPLSERSIAEDLASVADSGQGLVYRWDKPSDPGNYGYDKVSWVRRFPARGWYVASSVYDEELRRSAEALTDRIVLTASVILCIGLILGYLFIRRLSEPINHLADTAKRVRAGDLAAQSGLRRDDEIGELSRAFDDMVVRLRDNIGTLDAKVLMRTAELETALEQQAASEERQRLILNAIPAHIAYLDHDFRYRFANRQYLALVDRDLSAVIGQRIDEVVSSGVWQAVTPYLARAYAGESLTFEHSQHRMGAKTLIARVSLIPNAGADRAVGGDRAVGAEGAVIGVFVLLIDITEQRQTEKRLREAQKMTAVGQLAGGLAHDFNNLLSVIIGNLSTVAGKFAHVEGLQQFLQPAIRSGKRGADITERLLAFARRQPLEPQAVAMDALLRDVLLLLRRSGPANIDIVLCGSGADDGLGDAPGDASGDVVGDAADAGMADAAGKWAFVDPVQCENAVINLALNARDAMPHGGRIQFELAPMTGGEEGGFDEEVVAGEYIRIAVSDTGHGFSDSAKKHAFEPFFTTKAAGSGSGLGLSMVNGFVKQSGGYIKIDSEPGQGAHIILLLPMASREARSERVAATMTPRVEGPPKGLVLLVEDNADVRQTVRQQLLDAGYTVLEADEASQAMQLLADIEEVMLLISDVVLPGEADGLALAKRARQQRPELDIILMSGYAVNQQEISQGGFALIKKPFTASELYRAIAAATQEASGTGAVHAEHAEHVEHGARAAGELA